MISPTRLMRVVGGGSALALLLAATPTSGAAAKPSDDDTPVVLVQFATVAGEHFTSFNSIEHPDDVRIVHSERSVQAAFNHTFPPASVTLLQLEPAT